MAKVLAMVLGFMILSFAFISCLHSGRRSFPTNLFSFHRYRRQRTPQERPRFVYISSETNGENELSIDARTEEITHLLKGLWGQRRRGRPGPASTEHVYPELRLMARRYMKNEAQGNSLQATVLVHEVYLRLVDVTNVELGGARAVLCHRRADDAAHPGRRRSAGGARAGATASRLKVNLDEAAPLSNPLPTGPSSPSTKP